MHMAEPLQGRASISPGRLSPTRRCSAQAMLALFQGPLCLNLIISACWQFSQEGCMSSHSNMCVAQFEADPTRCTAPCGQPLECGHIYRGQCGACLKHRRRQASARPEAAAGALSLQHVPCQQNCFRALVCGHPCNNKCHLATEPCSGCSRKCLMHCVHGACSLACSKVRSPCRWCCHHQGCQ